MPDEPVDERHAFSRQNRLTYGGKAPAAELRVRADRASAGHEAVRAPAFGAARKKERIGIARIEKRGDVRPRSLAERHHARTGFRIGKVEGVLTDIAPAQIERFAAAATGSPRQPRAVPPRGRRARIRAGPSSSRSMSRATSLRGFFAMPRQCLESRSC